MKEWIKIGEFTKVNESKPTQVAIDGLDLVIYKLSGELFVINNSCPHQHAPVLAEGIREGYALTCPLHGWTFDLKSGKSTNGQSRLRKYDYRLDGDDIFIEINKDIF